MKRKSLLATVWGLLGMLLLATAGCRTFDYTDEDLAHERQLLAEGWAKCTRPGGIGWGGGGISPGIGNIHCPAGIGGGACHGK